MLYPYGFRPGELAPDQLVFQALAGTDLAPFVLDSVPASIRTTYHSGPGWTLYPTNGEYTEWAYRTHKTIAYTTELTSGCCTPDSGYYYGFAFPDDSVLVERVFRDNLPFAVRAIQDADALPVATARVESVWPEVRVSLEAAAPAPASLTVRNASGQLLTRNALADSLWRGRLWYSWRSDVSVDTARAVRVNGAGGGLAAELITLAGAEDGDGGWTGWTRSPEALMGTWSWSATGEDTLTSPSVDLRGRTRVWLQLWNKHRGSVYQPAQRGLVQFSADSGATWSDVYAVTGDGPAWYPVRVDLPAASGTRRRRFRHRFDQRLPGAHRRRRRGRFRESSAERPGGGLVAAGGDRGAGRHLHLHGRPPDLGDRGAAQQRVRVGPDRRRAPGGERRVPRHRPGGRPRVAATAVRDAERTVSAAGVGVDLVEVARVRTMLADKGAQVFDRLLTPDEAEYCRSRPDPAEHVAVRLAAKEAVYKALQGSEAARGIGWREIEVVRSADGRPDVVLSGVAAQRAAELGVHRVLLSLSHTHEAAIAMAVITG